MVFINLERLRNVNEIFNKYGHQRCFVKITKEQSKNGIMEHPDYPGDDIMRGKKCSKCGAMMLGGFHPEEGHVQNQFVFGCMVESCQRAEWLDVNGNLIRHN